MPEASYAREGPHSTGVSCAPLCGQRGHSGIYSDQQMSAPSPPYGAVTGLSIPRKPSHQVRVCSDPSNPHQVPAKLAVMPTQNI